MKKIIIAAVVLASLAAGFPVFAADSKEGKESEFYYKSISLEKIWPYQKGYVVQYRKGLNSIGRAYIPSEWFTMTASKGEIINLPPGNSWPSMSVYYKNGEFDHVRLYVHRLRSHQTWGSIPQNVNIDDRFENLDTLDIKY